MDLNKTYWIKGNEPWKNAFTQAVHVDKKPDVET